MATQKQAQPKLGRPDNPVLETQCTVQDLQNWLKELHALFPGDSVTLTIETDIHKIEAIIDAGRP